MKKITFALIMSMLLQTMCFAYEPAITGYEYIKKIDEAYMDSNPRKMEKNWKKLCEVNMQFCNDKSDIYYNILSEAKARRKEIRRQRTMQIMAGLAAGAAAGANVNAGTQAYNNYQQYTYGAPVSCEPRFGMMPNPIYCNRGTTSTIYNSYGQNIGTIKTKRSYW